MKQLTDTWIRCNRGHSIWPCFDLEADRAQAAQRRKRWLWNSIFLLAVASAVTWPMWGGR